MNAGQAGPAKLDEKDSVHGITHLLAKLLEVLPPRAHPGGVRLGNRGRIRGA
jgi:hypothetical protein